MLLRVCLILALVAALAATVVTWVVIKPRMEEMAETRDYNFQQWEHFEAQYKKTDAELTVTQEKLTETETALADRTAAWEDQMAKANEQQMRADELSKRLIETTGKLNVAQQKLAAWDALDIEVYEVTALIESEKKYREATEALTLETEVLTKVNNRLQAKLDRILGVVAHTPLPAGLQGTVVAVDPKWDFVVLDIGVEHQVETTGLMMVVRDSKLISKVEIKDVHARRSIANILPGWKIADVEEGDVVIPYNVEE